MITEFLSDHSQSVHFGTFKKFPAEFFMMYNTESDSLFTVILNNNSKHSGFMDG